MYKLTFFDSQVKYVFSNRREIWDIELEQELSPVIDKLKQFGEVEGATGGCKPGILGLVYEIQGKTFWMTYTVDTLKKEIKIYEFQLVSHKINWKTSLEQEISRGEQQPIYIPQIGDQRKFIKAIKLINEGINSSKELGLAFESPAKKDKDLARRGDYIGRPLIEFGLASRKKIDVRSPSIYILTERGKKIAQSNDLETRERLFVEALLGFYPIQMIIEETTSGNKELTKEMIQEVISLVSLGDCGGTTEPRRASSLRALLNWVTRWAGIPIRRKGNDGVQLYIPDIYAK